MNIITSMVFFLTTTTRRIASFSTRSASTRTLKTSQSEILNLSFHNIGHKFSRTIPSPSSKSLDLSSVRFMSSIDDGEKGGEYPFEMSEDDRYIFDLNGYIVIRGVLTPDEVAAANKAITAHESVMIERTDAQLRNTVKNTAFSGAGPGRKDLGQVFEWGPDSIIFKSILAHPRLVPYFHGILGKGYRMDHQPFVIASEKGAEGFKLHGGTIDCESGAYNHHIAYSCHNGQIMSALLGCSVILCDHDEGSGGFCIVPGSHKSNFKMPAGMTDGDKHREYIVQPQTKAGDVVLFSEGTVHGAMAWNRDYQRRICLYRFSPATQVYGRSYFSGEDGCAWPKKMYEDLTPAQMAVLEPPYANRLDRPEIQEDGNVKKLSRNARKTQHDCDLFGTKYF